MEWMEALKLLVWGLAVAKAQMNHLVILALMEEQAVLDGQTPEERPIQNQILGLRVLRMRNLPLTQMDIPMVLAIARPTDGV